MTTERLRLAFVVEEMENGYVWIFSDGTDWDSWVVKLDAAEDGDLRPWLKLARDEHKLE
jgi:hypothetical protein